MGIGCGRLLILKSRTRSVEHWYAYILSNLFSVLHTKLPDLHYTCLDNLYLGIVYGSGGVRDVQSFASTIKYWTG